jgi:DNA-binding CsgD family transcriptional regulator
MAPMKRHTRPTLAIPPQAAPASAASRPTTEASHASASDPAPLAWGDPRGRSRRRPMIIVGTVDPEWLVDRVSSDVDQVLGIMTEDALGQSFASSVHFDDRPLLLATIGAAFGAHRGADCGLRILRADGRWLFCNVHVSPLGRLPRFAFVITPVDEAASGGQPDAMCSVVQLPALATLSTRELDVVGRLVGGQRVPAISREIFLSQGTVRNHLSSAFHKLGVASQQELIDLVQAAS